MSGTDVDYGEEYVELQEKLIPEMWNILRGFNDLLEKRFGYRLADELPNIQVQYNNSSTYIDWEFRKVGLDPNENLVREAIRSYMKDLLYQGCMALEKSANFIGNHGSEKNIFKGINEYNEYDEKLWKYDYKKDLVDHIMLYFLETYHEVKKQWELEAREEGRNETYTVDDILTKDLLDEVIDSLTKLGFDKKTILDAEEKWSEVLLSVIKEKERKLKDGLEQERE